MNRTVRAVGLWGLLALGSGGCETNVNDGSAPFATTDRVSLTEAGLDPNDQSILASVSEDGNRVAYQSNASNLVPGDDGLFTDIYLRDIPARRTIRISRSSTGGNPNNHCNSPIISGDGQYVVYLSQASNLVNGDVNAISAVYRTHVDTGVTERVSLSSTGTDTDAGVYTLTTNQLALSTDGRYVVFASSSTNLEGAAGTVVRNVYRRDMTLAATVAGATVRVTLDDLGGDPDAFSDSVSISGDGRFVAFCSSARDLLDTVTPEVQTTRDIYLWDATTGDIVRVSNSTTGGEPSGDSTFPRISADGSVVVYQSTASNLVSLDTSASDIFHWTRASGVTIRCSLNSNGGQQAGTGITGAINPSVSRDGRFVAFLSDATNLFPQDFNGGNDAVVRDTLLNRTFVVSVATFGSHLDPGASSGLPTISADGRWVVFHTASGSMVGDDLNAVQDIFRRGPIE